MNNINFLRETLQNYIQFGVKLPINYMQMNGKEKNGYVIWRGFDPMILISSRDFFNEGLRTSTSDYRVSEDNIIYETNDYNKIRKVILIMLTNEKYEDVLAGMINELDNDMELKLK